MLDNGLLINSVCWSFYDSLLQDVIDLRKNAWVKRREDAGPKTIDQIHKEAQSEEIKQKIANMREPPPSRKSEDRSSQRRYFYLRGLRSNP